jgi:TRAP-type C4-dicarboxylate transport system permease small subunit
VRRGLDWLYNAAGILAALFLVGTLAMVMVGILGRWFDFHVPGTDAYAGYCMAAAGFLALAHTFARGEHIRVTLLLEHVRDNARHRLELWALSVSIALAGLFAFYSLRLAWQSFEFNDISTASDATPLWIPQLAMAAGTSILLVALVDALVHKARGQRAVATKAEPTFIE